MQFQKDGVINKYFTDKLIKLPIIINFDIDHNDIIIIITIIIIVITIVSSNLKKNCIGPYRIIKN